MLTLQETISIVDPTLKVVETFKDNGYNVGKVRKKGSLYIFKACTVLQWHYLIKGEIKALKLAKDIKGVAHIIKNYRKKGNIYSMLKQYALGKDLLQSETYISDTGIQKKLQQTVKDLHSLGIVDLDICRQNIILSPNKKNAKIIDFDGCKFKGNKYSSNEFDAYKKSDLENLEDCFI